ncbi:MAG: restriction endonuclease subunit S [Candidatus Omnitrophica bacterium]|nr:restriction endonuclease subunit S [Candidatus Omnitrophota bacterium]MDD5042323.1 restriction endonuclease subunit S [Candidatus Omnitrophota bacterium]MDD5500452.1 restriction endonuclease subunit S [Candidatus Omnitrophota bacterium]
MSEWKECKLGNVLGEKGYIRGPFGSALRRGEMSECGVPVYEQKNAIYNSREFRFFIDDKKFRELSRFQVKTDDLIISCSGTVGKISIIKEEDPKGIISQALLILRPDTSKIDLKYLYFFLSSKQGFELITQASHGSVQVNIAERKIVESIPLLLPSLPEQRAIAAVLSSLDNKIDLLHRQNKTLESLAETIWRKMFVEEADPMWRVGKLGEEMDITMGQSPEGSTYNEDKQGMIFFQGRAEFGFRFPETRLYCTAPKRLAKEGDTLVSVRAPVGDINVAFEDCCIGRGLASVRHRKGYLTYTLYKIRSLRDEFDSFEQQGTVFGSIGKDDFNNIETFIPNEAKIREFEDVVKQLDEKIFINSTQIRTLSHLRDTLLPKLMSGEAKVRGG